MLALLHSFGFGQLELTEEDFAAPGKITQLGRPPNRIDLITEISGVSFDEAFASRVDATLDGLAVQIIGRGPLLKNKRASGRVKDLADLEALEGS